jgi:hypothetical protein
VSRAQLRAIFESRHPDVEISALDRCFQRCPRSLHELGLAPESSRDHAGDLDVEAAYLRWIGRICLDEWRAALCVTTPLERRM